MRQITNMDTGQIRWEEEFLVSVINNGKRCEGKELVGGPISPETLRRVLGQNGLGGFASAFAKFKRIDRTKWVAGRNTEEPQFVFEIEEYNAKGGE